MFDTLLSSLKSRALRERDDFDTFEEYIAHTAGRGRLSTTSQRTTTVGLGGFLRRIKRGIGRGGYDAVDTVDAVCCEMLPRVLAATAVDTTADAYAMHAQEIVALTVMERFVQAVQVDRKMQWTASDERKMQRFYVIIIVFWCALKVNIK